MSLTGDGAPRPERRPAVGAMLAHELRAHLDADHGAQCSRFTWLEMVSEHARNHRVWVNQTHEHDVPERPDQ